MNALLSSPTPASIGQMVGCGENLKGPFIFNHKYAPERQTTPSTTNLLIPVPPDDSNGVETNDAEGIQNEINEINPVDLQEDTIDNEIEKNPRSRKSAAQKNVAVSNKSHKKKFLFGKAARTILLNWLIAHQAYPYASKEDVLELVTQTGLTEFQIKRWFINARNRKKILFPSSAKKSSKKKGQGSKKQYYILPGAPD